jgi:cobalt/nickel transport system permease protein
MHMADALISPVVGGTMWMASSGLLAWCARSVRQTLDDKMIPMMGVLGAFIFAAQMINFSIPATGSSGHLGGGMILAILLGPPAAFLVIASVLTVQALFFADGGMLALGCNIFNLGVFPAFIAYPLIYRPIVGNAQGGSRLWVAAMLAGIVGLQMGAFSVVMETTLSGISDLPFKTFVWLMQPIHLAIGMVEGLVTAAVVALVLRVGPEALPERQATRHDAGTLRRVVIGLLIAAVAVGGGLSWFASTHPDGLEWSMGKVSGKQQLESPVAGIHESLAKIQQKTAFLPDYGFRSAEPVVAAADPAQHEPVQWPVVSAGTSVAGLVGGLMTLLLAGLIGYGLKRRAAASCRRRKSNTEGIQS